MAKETKEELQQEKIQETVSKTETFLNENKNTIYTAVAVVLVIAASILCYQKFYLQPKKAEAAAQMYPAEAAFAAQNYEVALKGDGNNLGFEQIIDEYGSKASQAATLYAGICEFNLGNFESAITYLKKYKGTDEILTARAAACIGDAYVGLEDYKTALGYFEKAAGVIDNIYAATYLLKAGEVCEALGNKDKALKFYKQIKEKYPQTMEGYDIDKYISRIENKAE